MADSPSPTAPSGPTSLSIGPNDSSISTVTVFTDRAEVTRALDTKLVAAGRFEITFKDLPRSLVADSVRVKGSSTGGEIRILEVSDELRHVPAVDAASKPASAEPDRSTEEDRLSTLLEDLRARRVHVEQQRQVHTKTLAVLGKFVDAAMGKRTPVADLEYVASSLELHETRTKTEQAAIRGLDIQLRTLGQDIKTTQAQLLDLGAGERRATVKESREVSVLLDCDTADTQAHLDLTYVVNAASWVPAYDVRVDAEGASVETTYFGVIQQHTGENWMDTRLVLSTAQPSASGGVAPTLPSRHVVIAPRVTRQRKSSGRRRNSSFVSCAAPAAESFALSDDEDASFELQRDLDSPMAPTAAVATSRVEHGATASTFLIDRIATIESDNKPHKVTISVIPMASTFRHFCAPSASARCFLQANVINSSEYMMLPSAKANVFFGESYVGSTSLPRVSPGETFRCSLGPDPAITVDFRDLGQHASTKGYFSKSETLAHEFQTTVTNNKSVPVEVVLVAQLPKSTHSAITVKAVTPSTAALEAGTKLAKELGDVNTEDDAAVGDLVMGSPAAMPDADNSIRRRGKAAAPDAGVVGPTTTAVVLNPMTHNVVWALEVGSHQSALVPFQYDVSTTSGYRSAQVQFYDA